MYQSDNNFRPDIDNIIFAFDSSTIWLFPISKSRNKGPQLIKALDKLYLEDSTGGRLRMANEFRENGYKVGRGHVRTLMQIMR